MLRAAHPQEFLLETLVRLLKQVEDDSSCHPAKAHPEVFPRVLSLEEVKKDICKRWMTEMVAKYGEDPHKGPTGQGQRSLQLAALSRSF